MPKKMFEGTCISCGEPFFSPDQNESYCPECAPLEDFDEELQEDDGPRGFNPEEWN